MAPGKGLVASFLHSMWWGPRPLLRFLRVPIIKESQDQVDISEMALVSKASLQAPLQTYGIPSSASPRPQSLTFCSQNFPTVMHQLHYDLLTYTELELSLALSSNIYETVDLIGLGFFFFYYT